MVQRSVGSKECWVKNVGDCEMRVEARRDETRPNSDKASQDISRREKKREMREGDLAIELEPVAAVSRCGVLSV